MINDALSRLEVNVPDIGDGHYDEAWQAVVRVFQRNVGIRDSGKAQVTDGLENGQRVATTGAYELFKLETEVLSKVRVQVAPAKEEEEPEES